MLRVRKGFLRCPPRLTATEEGRGGGKSAAGSRRGRPRAASGSCTPRNGGWRGAGGSQWGLAWPSDRRGGRYPSRAVGAGSRHRLSAAASAGFTRARILFSPLAAAAGEAGRRSRTERGAPRQTKQRWQGSLPGSGTSGSGCRTTSPGPTCRARRKPPSRRRRTSTSPSHWPSASSWSGCSSKGNAASQAAAGRGAASGPPPPASLRRSALPFPSLGHVAARWEQVQGPTGGVQSPRRGPALGGEVAPGTGPALHLQPRAGGGRRALGYLRGPGLRAAAHRLCPRPRVLGRAGSRPESGVPPPLRRRAPAEGLGCGNKLLAALRAPRGRSGARLALGSAAAGFARAAV